MRKVAKNKGNGRGRRKLDTVGVVGSIPIAPTIHKLKQTHQLIEIPDDYEIIPAIAWNGSRPHLFRVLSKRRPERVTKGSQR